MLYKRCTKWAWKRRNERIGTKNVIIQKVQKSLSCSKIASNSSGWGSFPLHSLSWWLKSVRGNASDFTLTRPSLCPAVQLPSLVSCFHSTFMKRTFHSMDGWYSYTTMYISSPRPGARRGAFTHLIQHRVNALLGLNYPVLVSWNAYFFWDSNQVWYKTQGFAVYMVSNISVWFEHQLISDKGTKSAIQPFAFWKATFLLPTQLRCINVVRTQSEWGCDTTYWHQIFLIQMMLGWNPRKTLSPKHGLDLVYFSS